MNQDEFFQTPDNFERIADFQKEFGPINAKFATAKTIAEAEDIIERFKNHLEKLQHQKLSNTITSVKVIK